MARASKLTPEQLGELRAALKANVKTDEELAEKYGITVSGINYHRRVVEGRYKPSELAARTSRSRKKTSAVVETSDEKLNALNADILAGKLSDAELAEKHGITSQGLWRRKREVAPKEEVQFVLAGEQLERATSLVARIAQKHPQIFSDMIGSLVRKHPHVLLEAI